MTAVTFPLRLPRLAFAICGWRWQNDLHEIKYSVCMPRVVAVRDVTDIPEQQDEFDTDSESDADNDTDITFSRFGRTTRAHFRLDL